MLIAAFFGLALASSTHAYGAAMPDFTDAYCVRLTSKMLNPAEKKTETDKCLQQEAIARQQLADHWSLTPDAALGECRKEDNGSYYLLKRCLSGAIGAKCFRGELSCQWN